MTVDDFMQSIRDEHEDNYDRIQEVFHDTFNAEAPEKCGDDPFFYILMGSNKISTAYRGTANPRILVTYLLNMIKGFFSHLDEPLRKITFFLLLMAMKENHEQIIKGEDSSDDE